MKITKRLLILLLAAGLLMGSVSCEKGELPFGTSGAGQEYYTVTETKEITTKTESEINPLYVRALENQASAIDRVLAEQKASGEDLYQKFVLTLIEYSTPNAQAVWCNGKWVY